MSGYYGYPYRPGYGRICTVTNLPKDLEVDERDDDDALWDINGHFYYLTIAYVKQERNIELGLIPGGNTAAKSLLKEHGEKLIQYVYSNIPDENERIIEYRLANEKAFRSQMLRALLAYTMYALRSDGDEIGDNHGVNIKDGIVIDLANLRGRVEVSAHVERLLMRRSAKIMDKSKLLNYCVSEDDFRSNY